MMPKRTAGMYASHVLTIHPVVRRLTVFPHRWLTALKIPRCVHWSPVVLMMRVCRGRPLVCSHAHRLSLRAMRVQRLSMCAELLAVAKHTTVTTAYFASKAGKIAGAGRSRNFPLWRSYGDHPLSSNAIEPMASSRRYSATGPTTGPRQPLVANSRETVRRSDPRRP
jgi:hypothetical protein